MANIGFIGLGNMGAPMAINLAKAGHSVKAFDLSQEAVAKVVAGGGAARCRPSQPLRKEEDCACRRNRERTKQKGIEHFGLGSHLYGSSRGW